MLKILAWLWAQPGGRAQYEPAHVRIWADMVRRHLTIEHSLAVVTNIEGDFGKGVEIIAPPGDFENVSIPTWNGDRPQCFRRLSLFRPDAADIFGAESVVCMDLDIVICASLDPLFAGGEDFRICRGTAPNRAYNGSIFMLRLGSRPKVFQDFTLERAVAAGRKHVGSDQSWIARCLPHAPTWGPEHGVVSMQRRHMSKEPRIITYPGAVKPWQLALIDNDKFARAHYRRLPQGNGLILGYGESLWADVEMALDSGQSFSTVIAAPEAAAHWPGETMLADDDTHAERLAAMHGLQDVIFCGRSGGQTDGASR